MKDTIHNTTTTHFSIPDRLKILIGGKAVTDLEIETNNEAVWVAKTTAKTYVQWPNWINRFRFNKRRGLIHTGEAEILNN